MEKNDIFTFTAPSGVEVTAVVVDEFICYDSPFQRVKRFLCYSQNKLFQWIEVSHCVDVESEEWEIERSYYDEVIVDFAILPDYDRALRESLETMCHV
jgi:hypothetical protein